MAGKKQLLLKSIRELLSLNVLDDEIMENLKQVGIDRAQAKALMAEAKNPALGTGKDAAVENFFEKFEKKAAAPPRRKKIRAKRAKEIEMEREAATEELAEEAIEPEEASEEDMAEDLGRQIKPKKVAARKADLSEIVSEVKKEPEEEELAEEIEVEPEEEEEKPFVETEPFEIEEKTVYAEEPAKPEPAPKIVEDVNVSQLWEKGLMGTMNQNLAEMRRLKTDIESIIDLKVETATKKEMEKIKVLFDSQRALLISKVDTEIETKAKSFASMIELKLREMREINKTIEAQIEKLEEQKEKSKEEEDSLYLRLKNIDKVKEDFVSSMNSELIKMRSQNKAMVAAMNKQLKEMDSRINKTLELENQIVEGLVKDSQQKIEQMIAEKAETFTAGTEKQLNEIKKLKASYEAEHKQKLDKLEDKMKASVLALDSQVKESLKNLEELQNAITVEFKPESFKVLMQELNEFKSQFVDAIQENAKRFNEGIKSLNNQSAMMQKQFDLRAEKIDKKIAELDAFEKNFAKEIGVSLEKLTRKENAGKK